MLPSFPYFLFSLPVYPVSSLPSGKVKSHVSNSYPASPILKGRGQRPDSGRSSGDAVIISRAEVQPAEAVVLCLLDVALEERRIGSGATVGCSLEVVHDNGRLGRVAATGGDVGVEGGLAVVIGGAGVVEVALEDDVDIADALVVEGGRGRGAEVADGDNVPRPEGRARVRHGAL